jgi:hypothetical protein
MNSNPVHATIGKLESDASADSSGTPRDKRGLAGNSNHDVILRICFSAEGYVPTKPQGYAARDNGSSGLSWSR